WDYYVKSPCINSGCSVINGEIQTDPDGTPPDIGAIYYPHHHRVYFPANGPQHPSGIHWLSFPVLDDRTFTNGVYWNELGFMFEAHMQGPPNNPSQLSQILWSYDGEDGKMHHDESNWFNTDHPATQPKGYKVKFNTGVLPDPVVVNGFKADADTTPVAWVVAINHNPFVNSIGYFLPNTHRAGDALSRYLPGSNRLKYLDYVHTIKTRNWSTYRLREEFGSPWIVDPNRYTLSEGDMLELLLLPEAPREMYWNTGLPSTPPVIRPRATAFEYEEQLDYTTVFVEFDPEDLPDEVGLYVNGECMGASVVDSTLVDICLYPDGAKNAGELEIVFFHGGKGKKTVRGWRTYNADRMVFENISLRSDQIGRYAYISFTDDEGESLVPLQTSLKGNYPNPFNPSTNISFILANETDARLEVYNVRGQKVKTLCNTMLAKGKHTVAWNGRDDHNRQVSSGIYFYRLSTPEGSFTNKMMLMK
ncbi:MAG: T9SS type A sorting domain-containing protein, partial [Candidatus Cloacimonetes bacterium]|nr:T9SS type A sorting domain-containing protein [Candidatus Cloacimonadota bacterium]MDD3532528.1 T9SS type A sorting domain-containing protein [Candidatus Cloacimonadota bacterium]